MNKFLTENKIPNKVILFTDKEETPILFRGLTSYYREKIEVNICTQYLIIVWGN